MTWTYTENIRPWIGCCAYTLGHIAVKVCYTWTQRSRLYGCDEAYIPLCGLYEIVIRTIGTHSRNDIYQIIFHENIDAQRYKKFNIIRCHDIMECPIITVCGLLTAQSGETTHPGIEVNNTHPAIQSLIKICMSNLLDPNNIKKIIYFNNY